MESLETLDEEAKEQIKSSMLTSLGLDSTSEEGFEVNIEVEEKMSVNMKADVEIADSDTLAKVGLDFTNVDKSFKNATKSMTDEGYTCK